MPELNRHLWQQFGDIAKPYWFSEEKWKARGLLVLLVLLLLGQTEFNVLFNEQTGEFTSALAARNADRFWHSIKICFYILLMAVPIYAFYYYVRDKLAVYWRQWITNSYLDKYFSNRAFYKLNANTAIDNPDQRISEDINTFTQRSLYFLLIILGELIQLIAFSSVLWFISRELVYFLVVYAFIGTLITLVFFGRVLIGLNFKQLKREADFRFSLVRVRENAEAIALYKGEPQESAHAKLRFHDAFANYLKLIKWQLNLNFFQYAYSFMTIILPSAIIAARVISGELEVGRAIQAAGAFAAVLSSLTVIIENFESLSRFVAGIERLDTFSGTLNGMMGNIPGKQHDGKPHLEEIHFVQDAHIALENVTLLTPDHERTLIRNLTLSINPGQDLMITGASGEGKSSLLRTIAGLWNSGNGIIVRPTPEEMMFLPQHPYMILGSLRSQLLYPNKNRPGKDAADKKRRPSDEALCELLEKVKLSHLIGNFNGLDATRDWSKVLSVGEQQRLAIARVLLAQPRYAMLDEATSALDNENEENLYRQLSDTSTTLVSISHRQTVLKYHQQVLELTGNAGWKLHTVQA